MRLTRKKAIELCIELWTYLARYGGNDKEKWPHWEKYRKYGTYTHRKWHVTNDCWFCEYTRQTTAARFRVNCYICPLPEDGNDEEFRCEQGDKSLYRRWNIAKTPRTRKKYAKLFLAQIKELK